MTTVANDLKSRVKSHWEKEVCGTRWGDDTTDRRRYFDDIESNRYRLEPMLKPFARFDDSAGKRVLEIGVGAGTDFMQWLRAGATAVGRDLTNAAVELTKERAALEGFDADVATGDAEALEFPNESFDIYYSWGVLHHTPNTEATFAEAARVLKPGGSFRVMLYHYHSVATALVWLAQGPLRGRLVSPRAAAAAAVESPGTQLFSRRELRSLTAKYFRPESIEVDTFLGPGDLIDNRLSARYDAPLWRFAQAVYPAWFVRNVVGHRFGSILTLRATK